MLIGGASLIVLLAAMILMWPSQKTQSSPSYTNEGSTLQPSASTQPTPVKPTPTPELKPTPPPDPFREPTKWTREDSGSEVQILRNGNIITAIMTSPSAAAARVGRTTGDLSFKGLYEGRKIKGTIYIRMTKDNVSRCPEFSGEQKADLELTLSQDGNTLTGSREDYTVSADCNLVPLPRFKLKYVKNSP
jgi:hypothetical protein